MENGKTSLTSLITFPLSLRLYCAQQQQVRNYTLLRVIAKLQLLHLYKYIHAHYSLTLTNTLDLLTRRRRLVVVVVVVAVVSSGYCK